MADEESKKELAEWRKILTSKRSEIPFLNDVRKEIIISYKPEHVLDLMTKYINRLEEHNLQPNKKASIIVARNISQNLRHFFLRSINNLSEEYYSKVVKLLTIYIDMEIKYCSHCDVCKADIVFNECINRIRQQFGLYLNKREENRLDVLIQSKKMNKHNGSDPILIEKIIENFTKLKALPRELNNSEYIKYVLLFRRLKDMKSGIVQTNVIIQHAIKFMIPSVEMKTIKIGDKIPVFCNTDEITTFYIGTKTINSSMLKTYVYPKDTPKTKEDPDCTIIEPESILKKEFTTPAKPVTGFVDLTIDIEEEEKEEEEQTGVKDPVPITFDSIPGLADLIKNFDLRPGPPVRQVITTEIIDLDSSDDDDEDIVVQPVQEQQEESITQNLESMQIVVPEEIISEPLIVSTVDDCMEEEEEESTVEIPTSQPPPPLPPINETIEDEMNVSSSTQTIIDNNISISTVLNEIIDDFATSSESEILTEELEPIIQNETENLNNLCQDTNLLEIDDQSIPLSIESIPQQQQQQQKSIGAVIFSMPPKIKKSVKYNNNIVTEEDRSVGDVVFSVFNKNKNNLPLQHYKKSQKLISFNADSTSVQSSVNNKKEVKFNKICDDSSDENDFYQNRNKSTILEKISYIKDHHQQQQQQYTTTTTTTSNNEENFIEQSITAGQTGNGRISSISQDANLNSTKDNRTTPQEPGLVPYYRLEKYNVFVKHDIIQDKKVFSSTSQLHPCIIVNPVKIPATVKIPAPSVKKTAPIKKTASVKKSIPVKKQQQPVAVVEKPEKLSDFDQFMVRLHANKPKPVRTRRKSMTASISVAVSVPAVPTVDQSTIKRGRSRKLSTFVPTTECRRRTRSQLNGDAAAPQQPTPSTPKPFKTITKRRMTVGQFERRPSITTQVSDWISEPIDKIQSPIKQHSVAVVNLMTEINEPKETPFKALRNRRKSTATRIVFDEEVLTNEPENSVVTEELPAKSVNRTRSKSKNLETCDKIETELEISEISEICEISEVVESPVILEEEVPVVVPIPRTRSKSIMLNSVLVSESPQVLPQEILITEPIIVKEMVKLPRTRSRSRKLLPTQIQTELKRTRKKFKIHFKATEKLRNLTKNKNKQKVKVKKIEPIKVVVTEEEVEDDPSSQKTPEKKVLNNIKSFLRSKYKMASPNTKLSVNESEINETIEESPPQLPVITATTITETTEIIELNIPAIANETTTEGPEIVEISLVSDIETITAPRGRSRDKTRYELHNFNRDIKLDRNEMKIYKNRSRSVIRNDSKVSKIVRRSSQIALVLSPQIDEISKSKSLNDVTTTCEKTITPISNTVIAKIAKFLPDKETLTIANEQLLKITARRNSTIKSSERVSKRRKSIFIETISPKRRNSCEPEEIIPIEPERSFINLRSNNIPVLPTKKEKIPSKKKKSSKSTIEHSFEELSSNKFHSDSVKMDSVDSALRKTQISHKIDDQVICNCTLYEHKSQLSYNLRTGGYFCKNAVQDWKMTLPNDWNKQKNPYVRLNKVTKNSSCPYSSRLTTKINRRHTISISLGMGKCVFNSDRDKDCTHQECIEMNKIHQNFQESRSYSDGEVTKMTDQDYIKTAKVFRRLKKDSSLEPEEDLIELNLKRKKRTSLNSIIEKKFKKQIETATPDQTSSSSSTEVSSIFNETIECQEEFSFGETVVNHDENNFIQNVGSIVEITTDEVKIPSIRSNTAELEDEVDDHEDFIPDTYDSEEIVEDDEQYFSESTTHFNDDEPKEDSSSDSYCDPNNSSEYTEQNQLKIVFTKNLSEQYTENSTEITLIEQDHSYVPNDKYHENDYIYDQYSLNPVQYVSEEIVVNTDFDESNECPLDPMNISEDFIESDDNENDSTTKTNDEIPSPPFDTETTSNEIIIVDTTPMDISAEETVVTYLDDPVVDSFRTLQSSHIFLASTVEVTSSDETKIKYLNGADDDDDDDDDDDNDEKSLFSDEDCEELEEIYIPTDYQNLMATDPNDFNNQMILGSCVEVNTQFNETHHNYFTNLNNPPAPHLPNLLNGNTIITTQSGKKGKKKKLEIESQISVQSSSIGKKGRGRPRKISSEIPALKKTPKKRGRKRKKPNSDDEEVYRPPGTAYKKKNNFYAFTTDTVIKPRKKKKNPIKEKTLYASETLTSYPHIDVAQSLYNYNKAAALLVEKKSYPKCTMTASCSYPIQKKITKKKRIQSESPPLTVLESTGRTYSKNNVIHTVFVPADIERYIEEEEAGITTPVDLIQDDVYVDCLENSAQVYQEELVQNDR